MTASAPAFLIFSTLFKFLHAATIRNLGLSCLAVKEITRLLLSSSVTANTPVRARYSRLHKHRIFGGISFKRYHMLFPGKAAIDCLAVEFDDHKSLLGSAQFSADMLTHQTPAANDKMIL
jgi:hypothetical protein